jgi:hypothetical protein
MLRAVPPLDKVRDIRSAPRRRTHHDAKIIDLRAYTGGNVIRFPRRPNPASTK